jgi:hypothetical protein
MRREKSLLYLAGFALLVAACTVKAVGDPERPITIKAHIVIDVREMKNTANSIEDMVAAQAVNPQPAVAAVQPTKVSFLSVARRWLEPAAAYAEGGYDLKEITPPVKAALDGRAGRYQKLSKLKATGQVGEDNEGHVKNLGGDPDTASLVQAENRDREVIYQAIVQQNNLPPNSIFTVRSVFGEVQYSKARPGEKVQLANGEWTAKS